MTRQEAIDSLMRDHFCVNGEKYWTPPEYAIRNRMREPDEPPAPADPVPSADVRDETKPPPGFKWCCSIDNEEHKPSLWRMEPRRDISLAEAWRIYDAEHGAAPVADVRAALVKLDELRTAVDVSALAHRDASLLDRKLSEIMDALTGKGAGT